jgi:HSP20 family molecular chaperone IbpA
MEGTMHFLELMRDRVRAIHRAAVGVDLPEQLPPHEPELAAGPALDAIVSRFAELEWMVRQIPALAERLPPFGFAPPLDVVDTERELIVEVGVPGVDKEDVQIDVKGQTLAISGSLAELTGNGRVYYHAELPRGPFSRVVALPSAVVAEPRVEVQRGVIRIRLTKLAKVPPAKA